MPTNISPSIEYLMFLGKLRTARLMGHIEYVVLSCRTDSYQHWIIATVWTHCWGYCSMKASLRYSSPRPSCDHQHHIVDAAALYAPMKQSHTNVQTPEQAVNTGITFLVRCGPRTAQNHTWGIPST